MDYIEFTKSTVNGFQPDIFEQIKNALIPEYISFSVISEESITVEILAEKICDYFEKLELKTGKGFDKYVESYLKDLDSIVESRIAKNPRPKKNDPEPVDFPRARKYYEKAISIKKGKNRSIMQLVDYTRIMLCLYSAIIKNDFNEIQNFDFSYGCLNPTDIIDAMKNELVQGPIKFGNRHKFENKELYSSDTCTFFLTIILLYDILNDSAQGDTDNE